MGLLLEDGKVESGNLLVDKINFSNYDEKQLIEEITKTLELLESIGTRQVLIEKYYKRYKI